MRRPDRRVGSPTRLLATLLVLALWFQLVPEVAVADPDDPVDFLDQFTGSSGSWDSSWSISTVSSETVTVSIASNVGRASGTSGWQATALRPEGMADSNVEFKAIWNSEPSRQWGATLRHDGEPAGSDSGYVCQLNNSGTDKLLIYRLTNGYLVTLGEAAVTVSANQMIRCEVSGSTIRAKLWDAGSTEPSAWTIEKTDTTYAWGYSGAWLSGTSNRTVSIDDFHLTGTEALEIVPPDPGGGATFTEEFNGVNNDDWASEWTHIAETSAYFPYIYGQAGQYNGGDSTLTSLADPIVTDGEVIGRAIWNKEIRRGWGLVLRHDGSGYGEENGYLCLLVNDYSTPKRPAIRILRVVDGVQTSIAFTDDIDVVTNQWMKCVVEDDAIKFKIWDQGAEEPSGWDLEVTDSTFTTGQFGLYMQGGSNRKVMIDDFRLGPWPRTTLTVPSLVYSTTSDRATSDVLDQATISEDVYVFASPPDDTTEVEFWIDDPTMSGASDRVDDSAPFDLVGGSTSTADPWDTLGLTEGTHTVTAVATMSDASQEILQATITVDNIPKPT